MTVTIGMRLGQLAVEQGLTAPQIAEKLGVGRSATYSWLAGRASPNLKNAVAFAALVGRRLVVSDAGQIVAEGMGLANLTGLREAAGMSQEDLAVELDSFQATVAITERRAGPNTYLTTCQKYLLACSYRVGLAHAAVPCG